MVSAIISLSQVFVFCNTGNTSTLPSRFKRQFGKRKITDDWKTVTPLLKETAKTTNYLFPVSLISADCKLIEIIIHGQVT